VSAYRRRNPRMAVLHAVSSCDDKVMPKNGGVTNRAGISPERSRLP